MFLRALTLLLLICAYVPGVDAAINLSEFIESFKRKSPLNPKSIRLLIVHDKPGVLVEVKGRYKLYDPRTMEYISTRFHGKRKYIQPVNDGLKWGEQFPGIYQLLIVPDSNATTTLVDGIEYEGLVYIYDIGGAISVVNELDYDHYLSAILPSLVKENLSDEALAALVIAARTNVMYHALNAKNNFWAIDAAQSGYMGHAIVRPSQEIIHKIAATRNMVMSRDEEIGQIKPFPAQWVEFTKTKDNVALASISLKEAQELAKKGQNASQILKKAFPESHVLLIQNQ